MTPESVQAMIDQVLLRNSTNGDGSHSLHEDNRRNVQTARPCFYADFMKCQPLTFKGTEGVVNFATCTLLGAALTWWNGQIRTLGPDAYSMTWEVLKKKMMDKYCLQGKIKKLEIELWNLKFVANKIEKIDKYISRLPDNIYGSVKSSRPKTLDETIELANDFMDQKLHTYAKRQIRDNRANPKGNSCFECGAPGHFKRDCSKLKNKHRGNGNAQGWVYVVGNAEKKGNASGDPDSNVVTIGFHKADDVPKSSLKLRITPDHVYITSLEFAHPGIHSEPQLVPILGSNLFMALVEVRAGKTARPGRLSTGQTTKFGPFYHLVPLPGNEDMVLTRVSTNEGGNNPSDSVGVQLAAITAKLETIDVLKADIATLKAQTNSRGRSFGSRNDDGGSSGQYYHIPDEEKVEVASMHLEGDALNLYAWLSNDELVTFWEELVQAFTKHFGPAEFQNPDEYLCSIKQTDYVQEYRKEFARRSSRVSNWPDRCLLGVFLNGLKEELKSYVRIHKPRTVYNAMSLAIEFESKVSQSRPGKSSTWIPNSRITAPESKNLLEADDVTEEPLDTQEVNLDENLSEVAEISLHAIFGKSQPTTMKVYGTLNSIELTSQMVSPFGVQIGNGDVIRCSKVCRDLSIQLGGLKVVQDFYPFSIGGADLVLGIQWLATLNTVQMNWKEMFMIFTIDGKQYKLEGVSTGPHKSSSFQHLAIEPDTNLDIPDPLKPTITKYNTYFDEPRNLPPLRSRTHSIPLVPNSTPPNIRPYRYYQIQVQAQDIAKTAFRTHSGHYEFKTFVVECDASSDEVGAILSQDDHPVAYFSKGFSPSNRFKSSYDRELLALVLAVQKWNHYLLGHHFLIRTDHYTLKFLLEQRITSTEQQRLLLKLMPYDFSIIHWAGKENLGADALSRRPHTGALLTLIVPYCVEAEYSYNTGYRTSIVDRDDMLKLIRHNLHKAQDRMRQQANSKRRDISFEVGDYVFLKIQPYRQRSLAKRRYEKLSLSNGLISTDMAPLPITKDWEIDIQPHFVLAHRWVNEVGKQVLELLIFWCDRPQEEATWETYDLLADQFPNFRLEDKAFYREGSNDTIPVKVYTRKKNRVNETGLTEFNSIFG
ncbi:retrotransposon gag domain, retroviral aspartyl protease [Tanacetum coccineum]